MLGYLEDARTPITFSGNESLITIGGAGSGKTRDHVIPNLLRYPGSAFVLDIKNELFDATAAHRAAHFGPVYRFAPTDLSGTSHHYNPLDLLGTEAARVAVEAQVLATELIPENLNAKDPYWERKARDFVWAFAVTVALGAPPGQRTLADVIKYFGIRTNFEDDQDAYQKSETRRIVERLKALAIMADLPDLTQSASSLESGITSHRLESVFDTARSQLTPITRAPTAVAAMSKSDWHPLDLRRTPGTTVYLCLKPGDLRAFGPLVRLIFQQHVTQLTQDFQRRDDPLPVTFFLDEMPQLGAMPGLNDIVDIGRSAGVRLWMFAQFLGQIRSVYGQRADGLVNACAVKSFLKPDLEAAEFVAPQLGSQTNLFNGQRKPLAEIHERTGRALTDKILVLGRGEHPAKLLKHSAIA